MRSNSNGTVLVTTKSFTRMTWSCVIVIQSGLSLITCKPKFSNKGTISDKGICSCLLIHKNQLQCHVYQLSFQSEEYQGLQRAVNIRQGNILKNCRDIY